MIKIVFITSTLKSSGPVNQLYSLVRHLTDEYSVHIISLSPEPTDSRVRDFINLGVNYHTLGLSRFQGLFAARGQLVKCLDEIRPNLVHSQGLRPDMLMASINGEFKWCLTIHNFPKVDYRMKFGWLKGKLMTYQHLKAIRKCSYAIACSKSLAKQFSAIGIKSHPIQNGVPIERYCIDEENLGHKDNTISFVVVGSLIPRKNVMLVIKAFERVSLKSNTPMRLSVIGEGPERSVLEDIASEKVDFLGQIKDVESELFKSDIFVSASFAEGLPYTVLEALCSGLPLILSSIESHKEIASELNEGVFLFNDLFHEEELAQMMESAIYAFPQISRQRLSRTGQLVFSDKVMAEQYKDFYKSLSN